MKTLLEFFKESGSYDTEKMYKGAIKVPSILKDETAKEWFERNFEDIKYPIWTALGICEES